MPPKKRDNERSTEEGERGQGIVLDERAQVQPANRETAQRAGRRPQRPTDRSARRSERD